MGANAQTTVPTFVSSQVLTADQQNQSARTGVPVFATTGTRDAGFGGTGEKTLAEGQLCYVEGTGLQTYNGTSWVTWGTSPSVSAVAQVKSTIKTDTFSMSSSTFADVTGLSISITPTSASNKILVIASIQGANDINANSMYLRIVRDSTAIGVGDAASNRTQISAYVSVSNTSEQASTSVSVLDTPATTSATTYKIQVATNNNSGTCYVNRTVQDTNAATQGRAASTITVFEVTP